LTVLHEALAPYIRKEKREEKGREKIVEVLRHPLLPARDYEAQFNALYGRELQVKQIDLEMAELTRNWGKTIWLHERPFRATALQNIADKMTDAQYWALVAEVWIDAGDTYAERERWTQIWTSTRPYRDHVMTVDEHKALAQIPDDQITIYRGCLRGTEQGLSWSLNKNDARVVAARLVGQPVLVTGTVDKRRIQAFFSGRPNRKEDEVVVLPRHVRRVAVNETPGSRVRVLQAAE